MNEPKPILGNQNSVDWVHRRVSCTDEIVFSWLFNQVKTDMTTVNKISKKNQNRTFNLSGHVAKRKFSLCMGHESDIEDVLVDFRLGEGEIKIEGGPGSKPFIVTRNWRFEDACCELRLDNKPAELWQISQRVLYSAFFESIPPDQ